MHVCFFKGFQSFKKYIEIFLLWLLLGALAGALCGLLGALFVKTIEGVTALRGLNAWLLYCLPLAGVLSVFAYAALRVKDVGTAQVFESAITDKKFSFLLAPAIFLATALTHLCGGSAGKEGAALQLGGSISAVLGRAFRLTEDARRILIVCGMGAFFAAVFGTPVGACVFALEVVCIGRIRTAAIFPSMISCASAYGISVALGMTPERFVLPSLPTLSWEQLWRVALIAACCAVVSAIFCCSLHWATKLSKKRIQNEYIRIIFGAAVLILLTVLVGDTMYNGSGAEGLHSIFASGTVRHEAFVLKIIFTVVTVAAGFKGGEIIPSFFIGASLGASLSFLIGLNPMLGAAVGMAALFCGVTNCPVATIVLSAELFGGQGMVYIAIATAISFLLSGKGGLYPSQRFLKNTDGM